MRGLRLIVVVAGLALTTPPVAAQTTGDEAEETASENEEESSSGASSEASGDGESAEETEEEGGSEESDEAGESEEGDSEGDETSADASESSDGEESEETETDTSSGDETESSSDWSSPGKFGAADLDVGVSISGNIFYPYFEPMVDFGAFPISDGVTLGVGGVAGYGFCLLCGAVSAFSNLQIGISNWLIQGRALMHINSVGESLDQPLDVFVGAGAGPTFYSVRVSNNNTDAEARATVTGLRISPLIGLRYVFNEGPFFFSLEGRWDIEFVRESVVFDSGDGLNQRRVYNASDYSRRGLDLVVGIGARL